MSYLNDMYTARERHASRLNAARLLIKNKPFTLTTEETGVDVTLAEPINLGFKIFGMDAIGLNDKIWD